MNGEVNGTMEMPMAISDPVPSDKLLNQNKVDLEGCENATDTCEDSNNAEDSNHLDSASNHGSEPASEAKDLENENSNSNDNQKQLEESTYVPENANSNNIFTDNHCENSNQSDIGSMTSSHAKSETADQPTLDKIEEKCIDLESDKVFEKNNSHKHDPLMNDVHSDNEVESEDSSLEECSENEPRADDTVSINSDSEPEEMEDSSQESQMKNIKSDIIILNNERPHSQNGNSRDSPSPEVHEIISDNDDCVMAEEEKVKENNSDNKVQLRRSSRAIKRKRYTDDIENGENVSDIEEVAMVAPFYRKRKPIVINDTKALVEMAARQMKSGQIYNQKKEPTVVIIDTNSIGSEKSAVHHKHVAPSSNSSLNAQSLYQSIVARGTTVTPISSKSHASTQSSTNSPTPQPTILPSLTDDMYVVEAPSFIVPYVYEKPSLKPFREFVDILGKELEEQKAKEDKEKEQKDKEKQEATKLDKMKKSEEIADPEDGATETAAETTPTITNDNKVESTSTEETEEKKKKKKEKRRRGEDDDVSWDGESSSDSDDEILSDEDKTIIIKDKADSSEEIKDVTELTAEKVCSSKSDNYFDCSLGKFFINIGLSLVQEYVQSDLLKQQNRKLYREKKQGHNTKSTETSIASLMKNIEFSKENNAPYSFTQLKCEFCSFKTESKMVMAHHLETPHMKNNVYKCNYCPFEIRSPHDILYHMEAEHNIRGKLERAPAYHQCANCPFEDNGKGKLARHLIPCAKKFKPESNLSPPLEWEPPAKIPKIARSRNNMVGSYQSSFHRSQMGNNFGRPALNVAGIMPGVSSSYRPRGRSPMGVPPRAAPVHGAPIIRGGVMVRHNAPVLMSSNYPVANNVKKPHQPSVSITPLPQQPQPVQPQPSHNSKSTFVICKICGGYIKNIEQLRIHMQWIHKNKVKKPHQPLVSITPLPRQLQPVQPQPSHNSKSTFMICEICGVFIKNVEQLRNHMQWIHKNNVKKPHQPSISITPLPRQPQPVQPQPSNNSKSTFVICEICDGYIKDLEQLRNHMQWIHKVKIHPKMIYNRPPLNCQKCQFRFFTDQGLERHLLGSHGLVTSSMQDAANKGKDAGRCPVCGRVYQWKLLNHVARDHNLTLKPAHLSYKCTVCTATFGMYKQFENHVYSAHSVVAKRVMDKGKTSTPPAKNNSDSLLKPLKINDEITIIPQPLKIPAVSKHD